MSFPGVCPITANMAAGVNRRGTVSAARVMEPDTPEPPATRVSIFCYPLRFVVFDPSNWRNATDELWLCSGFSPFFLSRCALTGNIPAKRNLQSARTKLERAEKAEEGFKRLKRLKGHRCSLMRQALFAFKKAWKRGIVWEKKKTYKATDLINAVWGH